MTPSIALCADSESMKQPALLGLAGENFGGFGSLCDKGLA